MVAATLAKEGAAVAVAGPGTAAESTDRSRAREGWTTVPHTGPEVLATAALLADLGAHTLPLRCELDDEDACRRAVAYTALEFGGVDLLVTCGDSLPPSETVAEVDTPGLENCLRTSVMATFWLVQASAVYMPKGAAMVVTSHSTGRRGSAGRVGHAAGAAGVMSLARSLAAPMRERGIAINCLVCDGAEDPYQTARAYLDLATAAPGADTGAVLAVPKARRPL
ncbi:SDR family oxidoreductase [Thermobifida halotolerans]|uniref:SDR family oxidoreductase n=1 Tax=Thermobifida halotolerans TaxID=483545 RepID=A0AA97M3L9_9ACTN|nr:SDR family oxidoreductase [Thermobifida halotolerans]UOE19364.1 SDR family oxidoreductase [Thermobifida halotolerans]